MHAPAVYFVQLAVVHAAAPFSITGRTFPVCTCLTLRILLLAFQLVPASFFISESCLVALFSVSFMCGFQVSFLMSLTPRYVGVSSLGGGGGGGGGKGLVNR